ncbi:MAG TPA: PAS domain-containing protein, partial [Desulfobacterales bacterium]|nr:PAS domain-containing protein [Desulfobacterales bacterium]
MIFTSDSAGRFLDVNWAGIKMMGYREKAELMGVGSISALFHKEGERKKFFSLIGRKGFVKDYEAEFKRHD